MKIIEMDGKKIVTIRVDEACPLCGTPAMMRSFKYTQYIGLAESSCCGVKMQIDNPLSKKDPKDLRGFYSGIGTEFFEVCYKAEYIEPTKTAMAILDKKQLCNEVSMLALEISQTKDWSVKTSKILKAMSFRLPNIQ